jgi:leucyl aminopeptidase
VLGGGGSGRASESTQAFKCIQTPAELYRPLDLNDPTAIETAKETSNLRITQETETMTMKMSTLANVNNGVNAAALLSARESLKEVPDAAKFKWRACKPR